MQREPREKHWQLQKVATLGGIPSKDGYVIFIGVVNMMACKCMINSGTVTP